MAKLNGKNLFEDAKAMAENVADVAPVVNQTGMDTSFFDIYDNNKQTVNMSDGAAAGYYSDEAEDNGFINMDGAVGVSEFEAEPSPEEMAIVNSYSLEEHGPGYYTAMYEREQGRERLEKQGAMQNLEETKEISPAAKTIIEYADKSQDPMLLAFKDFLNNPSGRTLGNLVNAFSSVLTDYSNEFAANVEKAKAAKEAEATAPSNEYQPGYYTAMHERETALERNAAAEAVKTPETPKTHNAPSQVVLNSVNRMTNNVRSKADKKKSEAYKAAGIPEAIDITYDTGDDGKNTDYGYGGY